nr:hypothetical protein B0A51_00338 [Rachicladosporium sp. CCFEE 5018]
MDTETVRGPEFVADLAVLAAMIECFSRQIEKLESSVNESEQSSRGKLEDLQHMRRTTTGWVGEKLEQILGGSLWRTFSEHTDWLLHVVRTGPSAFSERDASIHPREEYARHFVCVYELEKLIGAFTSASLKLVVGSGELPEEQRRIVEIVASLAVAGESIRAAMTGGGGHDKMITAVQDADTGAGVELLMDEDRFAAARLAARLARQNLQSEAEPTATEAEVQAARARAEAAIAELRRGSEERLPEIRSFYTGEGWKYHIEHEVAILSMLRNPAEVLEKAESAGILGEMEAGIPMIRMHAEQTQVVAGDFRTMIEALSIDRGMQTEMMAIAKRLLEADQKIMEAIEAAAQDQAVDVTPAEESSAEAVD